MEEMDIAEVFKTWSTLADSWELSQSKTEKYSHLWWRKFYMVFCLSDHQTMAFTDQSTIPKATFIEIGVYLDMWWVYRWDEVCNQMKMYLILQVRHVFKNISLWTKSERKAGISNSCVVILWYCERKGRLWRR